MDDIVVHLFDGLLMVQIAIFFGGRTAAGATAAGRAVDFDRHVYGFAGHFVDCDARHILVIGFNDAGIVRTETGTGVIFVVATFAGAGATSVVWLFCKIEKKKKRRDLISGLCWGGPNFNTIMLWEGRDFVLTNIGPFDIMTIVRIS